MKKGQKYATKFSKSFFSKGKGRPKKNKKSLVSKLTAPAGQRVMKFIGGAGNSFMAPSVTTTHDYTMTVLLTASSGIMTDKVFNLNSMYSPEYSGGHQPHGRDTMSALYARYRVDKVQVWTEWHKTTESAVAHASIVANNSNTAFTGYAYEVEEQPFSKSSLLSFSTAGSQTKKSLSATYDLAKITGVSYLKYRSDDRYSSPIGSPPDESICMHATIVDALAGATTSSAVLKVKMRFYTTWFDPYVIGSS